MNQYVLVVEGLGHYQPPTEKGIKSVQFVEAVVRGNPKHHSLNGGGNHERLSEQELILDEEISIALGFSVNFKHSYMPSGRRVAQAQLQHDKQVNFPRWAKENGWAKLAENQDLPFPHYITSSSLYNQAQEDMLKGDSTGVWRKVRREKNEVS